MTQIGQMYEKGKIEYGNQKVRDAAKAMLDKFILKIHVFSSAFSKTYCPFIAIS